MTRYAVVIPALNEAGNIGALVQETHDVLMDDPPVEIIVVDDGSDDGSADEVLALKNTVPQMRLLSHDRRSGQSAAIRTAIHRTDADIIVTMDGDGQNPPDNIPALLAELRNADQTVLVNGWRTSRQAGADRRFASRAANAIRKMVTRDDCPDSGCGLKAFYRRDYLMMPFFATMHRFMPAVFLIHGYPTRVVPVTDRDRAAGQSKYTNWKRALEGLYDLLGILWVRSRSRNPKVTERNSSQASDTQI